MLQQNKQNNDYKSHTRRWQKIVLLLFVGILTGYFISACSNSVEEKKPTDNPSLPNSDEIIKSMEADMKGMDFSVFKHKSPQHERLACQYCHERQADVIKLKLASHVSCSICHVEQFKEKNTAFCGICHNNAETGDVKSFPALQSFNVKFDHKSHFKETNCATCHKSQGSGMTIPAGENAHANCFQCHTQDKTINEKNIGYCSSCHEQGTPNRITDSVKNIGFNFNHNQHGKLDCQSCHNATSGNQMSAINVAMHAGNVNNCATCHNEKRAFGANDFSDCRKCHQEISGTKSFGVRFSHANHAKTNCSTCHQTGGKGVSFSIPNSENAHTNCFQCHSPMKDKGGFTTSKCFQCHQPGNNNKFSNSTVTIASRFSHNKHNSLNCNSCHNIKNGNVTAPTIAMHKVSKGISSCATCHNNQKAFGGDDFTDCKRCHTSGNFKF